MLLKLFSLKGTKAKRLFSVKGSLMAVFLTGNKIKISFKTFGKGIYAVLLNSDAATACWSLR